MVLQDIFVYEQPDFVFWVVHQTENTYRTGSDVKVLFHKFRFGKGKTGAADLLGESGCFELFAAWKDQQIEGGFWVLRRNRFLQISMPKSLPTSWHASIVGSVSWSARV